MSKEIKYRPGELHAVQLDENTVALVMPVDYAAAVRDALGNVAGHPYASRRKWTSMVFQALHGLKDFPMLNTSDIVERSTTQFNDNPVVLP